MNPPPPLSTLRALWIMGRLALRRQLNLLERIRFLRRFTSGQGPRTATSTKSGRRSIFGGILFLFIIFNGFFIAARGLANISAISRNLPEAPDKFVVSAFSYARLVEANQGLRQAKKVQDATEREKLEGMWHRHLDRIFATEIRWGAFTEEEEGVRLRQVRERFAREGASGFVEASPNLFAVSQTTWPSAGMPQALFIRALAFLLAFLTPTLVCTSLGTTNKDLGQLEWSFEWLYTFPVSSRALFASRLLGYSLLNQFVWWLLFPFAVLIYVAGGFGWSAVPIGFGVALYLALVSGAVTLLIEVGLRKFFNVGQIKNIQALFTVAGAGSFLLFFAALLSKPVGGFLLRATSSLPTLMLWNPLSVPLIPAIPAAPRWQVLLSGWVMVLGAAAVFSLSVIGCERLTRDGLIRTGGPYQGSRQSHTTGVGTGWLRGIAGHEALLLARDRNLFVRSVYHPASDSGLLPVHRHPPTLCPDRQLSPGRDGGIRRRGFLISQQRDATAQPRRQNAVATHGIPAQPGFNPAGKGCVLGRHWRVYGGVILFLIVHFSAHLQVTWSYVFLAMYGIVVYAFIASGLGAVTTNVLETDRRAQVRQSIGYLYFVLAAMYANAIYAPSPWTKLGQLVLSTLLAVALWQKVRDYSPYFLDPTQWPPRTIDLADGMIAALAFFVLQSLMAIAMHWTSTMSAAEQITVGYALAGVMVGVAALAIFWTQGVSKLWQQIGLVSQDGQPLVPARILTQGAFWGAAAALGALGYVRVLNLVPQWQTWKQDAELSSFCRADQPLWICALVIVAAPIVEEFIFRGLIFQGLRRSAGVAVAVVGSAALFALVHPPIAVIPVFGLGIAAAISLERSGCLWSSIVTHAIYNACALLVSRL